MILIEHLTRIARQESNLFSDSRPSSCREHQELYHELHRNFLLGPSESDEDFYETQASFLRAWN